MKQLIIIFCISLLASSAFMTYWQGTVAQRRFPLGFDIYLRWAAARAVWQGQSPYSPEVTAQADLLIYGRPRTGNEIAFDFYDPAYAAVVLSPVALVPVSWAGLGWSALSLALLITVVVYWSWHLKPRPKPLMWGMVVLGSLFFRPAIMTILNGQYSLFLVGCAAVAWWLIFRKHDLPAGIVLAISTIKPSIFLFAPLVILLWAVRWRRWWMILGFVGTFALLSVITFAKIGWWIPDFLARLTTYSQTVSNQFGLSWSSNDLLSPFGILWLGQSLVLLTIGLVRLWRADKFPWLASIAALNLNLLFTPHIIEYDLGILFISLLWLGAEWSRRRWGMAAWLFLVWVPWLSWGILLALGGTTEQWQNVVWQIFPNLILIFTLAWLRIEHEPLAN